MAEEIIERNRLLKKDLKRQQRKIALKIKTDEEREDLEEVLSQYEIASAHIKW